MEIVLAVAVVVLLLLVAFLVRSHHRLNDHWAQLLADFSKEYAAERAELIDRLRFPSYAPSMARAATAFKSEQEATGKIEPLEPPADLEDYGSIGTVTPISKNDDAG